MQIEQGDILKVEKMTGAYLVVSKNYFNETQRAILCPIVKGAFPDPLHIDITTDEIVGAVLCEHVRLFDLKIRGYRKVGRISYADIVNITDAIQSIFDYY